MNVLIDGIYNNFTVLGEAGKDSSNGEQRYLCLCVCGAKREVRKSNLGKIKGCGCQRQEYKPRINNPKPRPTQKLKISRKIIKNIRQAEIESPEDDYHYQPSARQKLEDMRIEREHREIYDF